MSNSKYTIPSIIFALAIVFSGCLQTRQGFVFEEQMSAAFFKEIPTIARNTIPRRKLVDAVDSIHIYRTSFTEKLIERNNVIDYVLVNDSSKTAVVKYKQFDGYYQQLYLIHLITKPKNENAFVYFTVKYDADEICIGFGPAYFGYLDASRNLIRFVAGLKAVKSGTAYQLSPVKASTSMLFVARSIIPGSPIRIEKIVNDNPNKIGGQKSVVYSVYDLFRDQEALQFYPVQSMKLNP